jgi:hypothetical protein
MFYNECVDSSLFWFSRFSALYNTCQFQINNLKSIMTVQRLKQEFINLEIKLLMVAL